MISYLVAGALTLLAVGWVINTIREQKQRKIKKENEKLDKERLSNLFKSVLPSIYSANQGFRTLTRNTNGYFSNYKLSQWRDKHGEILKNTIFQKSFEDIGLTSSEAMEVAFFKSLISNDENFRESFNKEFLQYELIESQTLLSSIDGGKSLDDQQRDAIIRDEDNSLIIAGAGCGKTTTIMGKVNYLIKRLEVLPEEILLVSFTKKSADDLAKKVNIKGIDAKTFHKLGLDIVKEAEGVKASLYDQEPLFFIKDTFKKLVADEKYLSLLTSFFSDYIKINKDDFEIENQSEHIQHLKDQNIRPYKKVEIKFGDKTTFRREIVKSQQECRIANFFLFNGINYKYEEPYEISTRSYDYRQYTPDFSIYQNNKRIYLEHYALNKNGDVPPFFATDGTTIEQAKRKYLDGIEWKRNIHQKNQTVCLETFSYHFQDGIFEKVLLNLLESNGFIVKPLSDKEKWDVITENASDEVDSLITLFNTFLSLYKSCNITFKELQNRIKMKSGFDKERSSHFIALFYPLYQAYETMLRDKEQIDFSDMINKAVNYLETNKYTHKYKYIIIDEFQDISAGRYRIINAFKKQTENVKLFAVGDDWQSIYRFTGSDISLFNNFEKYFGYTHISKIETTYRFGLPMIDISGEFVMKNPSQVEKHLKNKLNTKSGLEIFYSLSEENDDTDALEQAINKIIQSAIQKSDTEERSFEVVDLLLRKFYVLGRYNHDFKRIRTDNTKFTVIRENILVYEYSTNLKIELEFFTVHRSKGLEADYVFVLNCNSGKLGFPSEMSDDSVLMLLLGDSEKYPNSEERRLFYVALTRAKVKTSVIADRKFPSKFIQELESNMEADIDESKKCPNCKSGDLQLKSGITKNKRWAFYGCSNFATYDCQYRRWLNEAEILKL